ncbi:MAG: GlsB/YeaQ/YmgE family stress response membrane protein [Solirubrobacterales bacterium]
MAEHRNVPEPGELIATPRPSWAPAFFALGALALIAGIYAGGFIFSPFVYSIVGAIIILAAFRSLARSAIRDYYRLPRRQETRSATLPVETISGPPQP